LREDVATITTPPVAHGETVLVVDDEPDMVDLIRLALKGDGYRIETAFDGQAALRRLHEQRPALVLLDWRLPGMDGLEVCRRLRADADVALSEIPVVLVTGMSGSENVAAGFDAGVSDYLTKSFSPAYLRSRVRDWLLRAPTQARRVVEEVQIEVGQQHRTAS
jgi:two-component system phosphate regulon response regulator PhoB